METHWRRLPRSAPVRRCCVRGGCVIIYILVYTYTRASSGLLATQRFGAGTFRSVHSFCGVSCMLGQTSHIKDTGDGRVLPPRCFF